MHFLTVHGNVVFFSELTFKNSVQGKKKIVMILQNIKGRM